MSDPEDGRHGCKECPGELHECPYSAELGDPEEPVAQCTCCADCTHECAMDI